MRITLTSENIDMVVKKVAAENSMQNQNTTVLIKNFLTFILSEEPKSADSIAEITGIPKTNVESFLNVIIKEGFLTKKDSLYDLTEKADKTKERLKKSNKKLADTKSKDP